MRLTTSHLIATLVLLFGAGHLALPFYLGHPWLVLPAAVTLPLLAFAAWREKGMPVSGVVIGTCAAVSVAIMLLGGQGHVFFANVDWQVRNAVLRDLAAFSWPFTYNAPGHASELVLRAPLGMYLLPALVGKATGYQGAQLALLLQNSVLMTIVLSLASVLFKDVRARVVGLVVFVVFSGMDALGAMLTQAHSLSDWTSHLEGWAGIQYSSSMTLAMWVPNHALPGWTCGVLFLLTSARVIPVGFFWMAVPVVALWSPLVALGIMPFAALTAARWWLDPASDRKNLLLPFCASVLSLVSFAYLLAGARTHAPAPYAIEFDLYALFLLLEVAPFLYAVGKTRKDTGVDASAFAICAGCLAMFPWLTLGRGVDFMMRASIPALGMLIVWVSWLIVAAQGCRRTMAYPAWGVIVVLIVGALTPAHEIARATRNRPSPHPGCDLWETYEHTPFARSGHDNYLIALERMPTVIRPGSLRHVKASNRSGRCWARPWELPRQTRGDRRADVHGG